MNEGEYSPGGQDQHKAPESTQTGARTGPETTQAIVNNAGDIGSAMVDRALKTSVNRRGVLGAAATALAALAVAGASNINSKPATASPHEFAPLTKELEVREVAPGPTLQQLAEAVTNSADPDLTRQWPYQKLYAACPQFADQLSANANNGGVELYFLDGPPTTTDYNESGQATTGQLNIGDSDPNPFYRTLVNVTNQTDPSHFSEVAGVAVAKADAVQGRGIVAGKEIYSIAIVDERGYGGDSRSLLVAINQIKDIAIANPNQKFVVNISFTFDPNSGMDTGLWNDSLNQIQRQGNVLLIAAAGNQNQAKPRYPAALGSDFGAVLSVGGVDQNENYWQSTWTSGMGTNRGAEVYSYGSAQPVYDADPTKQVPGSSSNNSGEGTSLAAPMVAATATEVWRQHPDWTATQVANHIVNASRLHTTSTGDRIVVLDLCNSVRTSETPPAPTPTATTAPNPNQPIPTATPTPPIVDRPKNQVFVPFVQNAP